LVIVFWILFRLIRLIKSIRN